MPTRTATSYRVVLKKISLNIYYDIFFLLLLSPTRDPKCVLIKTRLKSAINRADFPLENLYKIYGAEKL